MGLKRILVVGSGLAVAALTAGVAWANCGVNGAQPIATPLQCTTSRGNFTATATGTSSSVTITLSGGIDNRNRTADTQGFGTNGLTLGSACFAQIVNQNGTRNDFSCGAAVGFHDLRLVASLFP